MIRVAIAEDHTLMRWALRQALSRVPDLEVVGDAGTVDDVLAMIREARPEVLLLDLTLPDHTGYDVLAELRDLDASPLVLVLAPQLDLAQAALGLRNNADLARFAIRHGYVAA